MLSDVPPVAHGASLAEWLRRQTQVLVRVAGVGSNPTGCIIFGQQNLDHPLTVLDPREQNASPAGLEPATTRLKA